MPGAKAGAAKGKTEVRTLFGFVKPYVPELRVRTYQYYRALYCGLCREMKKRTGWFSAFSLSYDMVFLVLLQLLYSDSEPALIKRRCPMHPIKKHLEAACHDSLSLAARVSAVLVAAKLRDDASDERGMRRLRAKAALAYFRRAEKKADMPQLSEQLARHLAALSALEKSNTPSIDAPAALSGELLGDSFAAVVPETAQADARRVGVLLGRIVYKLDALADYKEDTERNRYNPYRCLYADRPMTEAEKENAKNALRLELASLEEAMSVLPLARNKTYKEILENILYLGLTAPLNEEKCENRKEPTDGPL